MRYRSLLENLRDPLTSEDSSGRELSEILLGPVKEDLRKGAKLVIAPDRDLHSINLEALPDPNDPSKYVIEKATLSVAPSLTLLAARRAHSQARAQIAAHDRRCRLSQPRISPPAQRRKRDGAHQPRRLQPDQPYGSARARTRFRPAILNPRPATFQPSILRSTRTRAERTLWNRP